MRRQSWLVFAIVGLASTASARPGLDLSHMPPAAEMRRTLATAPIVTRQANGDAGANASQVLTIRLSPSRRWQVLFKPAAGEVRLRNAITPGTYYRREVAVSRLSELFDLGLVPPTVKRTIDGQRGSVQLWSFGPMPANTPVRQLHRGHAEVLRVFDYIIGNSDRHSGNMILEQTRQGLVPLGIDHGLSLPNGTIETFRWPVAWVSTHAGPLLDETRQFIRGIDAEKAARSMANDGIERTAIVHALRRIERVKRDPSFIALGQFDAAAMLRRMDAEGRQPTQGLDATTLAAIDAVADRALASAVSARDDR